MFNASGAINELMEWKGNAKKTSAALGLCLMKLQNAKSNADAVLRGSKDMGITGGVAFSIRAARDAQNALSSLIEQLDRYIAILSAEASDIAVVMSAAGEILSVHDGQKQNAVEDYRAITGHDPPPYVPPQGMP